MEILSFLTQWLALAAFAAAGLYSLRRLLRQMELIVPPKAEEPPVLSELPAPPHPLRSLLLLAIVSRLLLMLWMGLYCHAPGAAWSVSEFLQPWVRWDANHYIWLAENGYTQTGNIDKDVLLVFYPLYPLLIKGMSLFTGGQLTAAAFLAAGGCMLGAVTCLYKLLRMDYSSGVAYRAVKYFLLFPFAFFLGIPFAESLFILLTAGCFYAARRRCWWLAGVVGMLCTLCRLQGIIVFGGAVLYWLLDMRARRAEGLPEGSRRFWRWDAGGLFLGLIPLGSAAYLGLNYAVSGSAWTFLRYEEEHWNQRFGFFAKNIANHVRSAFTSDWMFSISTWIPSLILFFAATACILILLRKRAPLPLTIFAYVYTFVSYSATWLLSGSRYTLANIPLFLAPALVIRSRWADRAYTAVSFALMFLYAALFVLGNRLY